eukprot:GEMP01003648.1.p1 GENE.GEMP01003648.1~~GEMP01003648.1.p1  ORF type:complete len:162 (+),score=18.08 GEMP01003648.1:1639-2124(+)
MKGGRRLESSVRCRHCEVTRWYIGLWRRRLGTKNTLLLFQEALGGSERRCAPLITCALICPMTSLSPLSSHIFCWGVVEDGIHQATWHGQRSPISFENKKNGGTSLQRDAVTRSVRRHTHVATKNSLFLAGMRYLATGHRGPQSAVTPTVLSQSKAIQEAI